MIQLTEEQFKEYIEAAHRAGQHNQGHCDPSAYEAMVYYEKVVKNNAVLPLVSKRFDIDFKGNMLVGLEIENNTPRFLGAMNGGGHSLNCSEFTITETTP